MKFVVLALGVVVAGCGSSTVWTHPTKEVTEYKRELADCERFFSSTDRDTEACMIRRGWRREGR
jgi:hypothetical protein